MNHTEYCKRVNIRIGILAKREVEMYYIHKKFKKQYEEYITRKLKLDNRHKHKMKCVIK